jgi:hypothetical protein
MKLYSTITSERATKGQGGNDFLVIRIYKSDNTLYGCLLKTDVSGIWGYIACDNEKMRIKAANPLQVESFSNSLEGEKGKRQKGEKCEVCGEPLLDNHSISGNRHSACI